MECVRRRRRHRITQDPHSIDDIFYTQTYDTCIYMQGLEHSEWRIESQTTTMGLCAATCDLYLMGAGKKHERFGMCTPRGTLNMLFSTCLCARRCDEKIVYLYIYNKGHCEVPVYVYI